MGQLTGNASAEIEASLERVWEVVADVVAAPQWQGGIDEVRALEQDSEGRATLVETVSDIKVRKLTARVRFHYEGPARLRWTQEKGDMKALQGAWELEALGPGRTRATYRLEADTGRVLGLVIRGPVEAATRALFVNGRPKELKRRVEAD
jgi:carbon monoxide dehydrogenase subunit G